MVSTRVISKLSIFLGILSSLAYAELQNPSFKSSVLENSGSSIVQNSPIQIFVCYHQSQGDPKLQQFINNFIQAINIVQYNDQFLDFKRLWNSFEQVQDQSQSNQIIGVLQITQDQTNLDGDEIETNRTCSNKMQLDLIINKPFIYQTDIFTLIQHQLKTIFNYINQKSQDKILWKFKVDTQYFTKYLRKLQNCELSNCQQCSDGDPDQCQICQEGYVLTSRGECTDCAPFNCLECEEGDPFTCQICQEGYVVTSRGECTDCVVFNCLECEEGDPSQCQTCQEGYTITSTGECTDCVPFNCLECEEEDTFTCQICQEGYVITSRGECTDCVVFNCLQCIEGDPSQCQTCQEGYVVTSRGECTDCAVSNCLECEEGDPFTCQICQEGYVVTSRGECTDCVVFNCLQCEEGDPSQCQTCQEGFALTPQGECSDCIVDDCLQCIEGDPSQCQICQEGYVVTSIGECTDCVVSNCLECEEGNPNQCQTCQEGFALTPQDECSDCIVGDCLQCEEGDPSQCQTCQEGFALTPQGECSDCIVFDCLECEEGDPNQCQTCQEGFVLIPQGECSDCIVDDCLQCEEGDPNQCQTCQEGFALTPQDECSDCIVDDCLQCEEGDPSQCQTCQEGFVLTPQDECSNCIVDDCLQCEEGDPSQCQTCQEGFVLIPQGECSDCIVDDCLQCIEGNPSQCQTCQEGFQLTPQDECSDCIVDDCLQCEEGDPNQCQTCQEGFVLIPQGECSDCIVDDCLQCIVGDPNRCQTCQDGFQLILQNQCSDCVVSNCQECENEDPNRCSNCQEGFSIIQGQCFLCNVEDCSQCFQTDPNSCQSCNPGYQPIQGVCQEIQCAIQNCLQCQEDDYLDCAICENSYVQSQLGECLLCQVENCADCIFNSPQQCDICQTGYILNSQGACSNCIIDNCLICQQGQPEVCSQCQQRYQLSQEKTCFQCLISNCEKCQNGNSNKCQTCQQNYGKTEDGCAQCLDQFCIDCLDDNQICNECPTGYQLSQEKTCFQCLISNCEKCQNGNSNQCQTCQQNYGKTEDGCAQCLDQFCIDCLDDNQICNECPTGYQLNNQGECEVNCLVSNCEKCFDENEDQCLQCNQGYQLTDNGECQTCSQQNCFICSTTEPNICEQCNTGYFPLDGKCEQQGFFFSLEEIYAIFNQEYTEIQIQFSQPANILYYDCTELFESIIQLGENPWCIWKSNTQLRVLLGPGFTLQFDGTGSIVLISQNTQKLQRDIGSDWERLQILVQSNGDLPVVKAVITGPLTYSSFCATNDLFISGLNSQVFQVHSPTYSWNITGHGSDSLQSSVQSVTEGYLQLSVLQFPSAQIYTITLQVSNLFGNSDSSQYSFELTQTGSLSVSLDNQRPVVQANQQIELFVWVLDFCGESGSPVFEWAFHGLEGANDLPLGLDPGNLISQESGYILNIQPYGLAAGFVYIYNVTAQMSELQGRAQVFIQVKQAQIVAEIDWVGSGDFNSDQNLVLDASKSYDPDSLNSELFYSWVCLQEQQPCRGVQNQLLVDESNQNNSILEISSQILLAGQTYSFSLTVSTESKASTTSVTLTGVSAGSLQAFVQKFDLQVEKSRDLLIILDVSDDVNSIQWSQNLGLTLNLNLTDQSFLYIPKNTLQRGEQYGFEVTIVDSSLNTLVISFSFYSNLEAICQSGFSVTPIVGTVLTQEFYLAFEDCYDRDSTDRVNYSYGILEQNQYFYLMRLTQQKSLSVVLPPGTYNVTGEVCDYLYGCSSYNIEVLSVQSRNLQDTLINLYIKTNLNQQLIPFNTFTFSSYYNLTSQEITNFLDTLKDYFETFSSLEQVETSALISSLNRLVNQVQILGQQLQQAVQLLINILQSDSSKLTDININQIYEVADIVLLDESTTYESEQFKGLMNLVDSVVQNKRENLPPYSSLQTFTYNQILTTLQVLTSQQTSNYTIQIDSLKVMFPSQTLVDQGDLIATAITHFPQAGEFSDIVDVSLYSQGNYSNYSLILETGSKVSILNPLQQFQIFLPCEITEIELYQCRTYNQQTQKWENQGCQLLSVSQGICTLHANLTSKFQVLLIQDDIECTSNDSPLYLLGILLCFSFLHILTALSINISRYTPEILDQGQIISLSIKTPSDSTDLENSNFLEFEKYVEKPKAWKRFILHHLLFGQYQVYYILPYKRAFILCWSLVVNLACIGWILNIAENTDQGTEDDHTDSAGYFWVGIISAVVVWILVGFLEYSNNRKAYWRAYEEIFIIAQWTALIGFLLVAIVGVVALDLAFCGNWNKIWAMLFLFSFLLHGLYLESMTAFFKVIFSVRIN